MADSRVPGIVSVLALLVGVALAVASELAAPGGGIYRLWLAHGAGQLPRHKPGGVDEHDAQGRRWTAHRTWSKESSDTQYQAAAGGG
jgi:hypothetical protein